MAHDGNLELVLDAALGDVLQLSHSDEGYELKQATTSSGKKLEGVFDALQDGEGDIFLTTSTDLSRFHSSTSKQEFISKPNNVEEFKSIARDTDGRLWVVGDHLYVSSDSGGHWQMVNLPMLGPTQSKRVRPIGGNEKGIAIALDDRGVVFLRW